LTETQVARLQPFFPNSHGKPRVDEWRVWSGVIVISRNSLRWYDAPRVDGQAKTPYNRWKWWGEKGVFARMMAGLASADATPKTVMMDATYFKAHRTATSLRLKNGVANRYDRRLKVVLSGVAFAATIMFWVWQPMRPKP
jgi:transposase